MRYAEEQIQEIVVYWARKTYQRLLLTCAPATAKNAKQGVRNKKMGLLKGWPDLFFAEPRGKYHGLFVELKQEKGSLSEAQRSILEELTDRGYLCRVCYSADSAILVIKEYMKLPFNFLDR